MVNRWHDRRPLLPVQEAGGLYQIDPMLGDVNLPTMSIRSNDLLFKSFGAHAYFLERKKTKE